MTSDDAERTRNERDPEEAEARRKEIETQRSDEKGRQDRFSRWDDLQDQSRARAESLSQGKVSEPTAEVVPEVEVDADDPKRSQLVIRLEKARELLKRAGRPDPTSQEREPADEKHAEPSAD